MYRRGGIWNVTNFVCDEVLSLLSGNLHVIPGLQKSVVLMSLISLLHQIVRPPLLGSFATLAVVAFESSSSFVLIFACPSLFDLIDSISTVSSSQIPAGMTFSLCSTDIVTFDEKDLDQRRFASFQSDGFLGQIDECFM